MGSTGGKAMKDGIMFKNYMTTLGELFNKDLSDTLKDMYWEALKPYSDEDCEEAFKKSVSLCKFFPKPADLIEFMGNESAGDKAVLAWVEVDKAVRTIGNYSSVKFSDPVIHSVIQALGGWSELSMCSNLEWKWKKKEFEVLYPTMAAKGGHEQYLQGDCEQSQRLNDRADWVKPVAQVGGVKKDNKLLTEGE
jgi:hypothetical protein